MFFTLTFAFALSILLTPAAGRLGRILRIVDRPTQDPLKIHARPIPLLGGVAVVAAALGALSVTEESMGAFAVAAVLLALAVGLIDDAWTLPPSPRVLLLTGSGLLLAAGLPLAEPVVASASLVILLCLVCSNAANLLDGQDGLCSGLAGLAALGLAGAAQLLDVPQTTALGLAVAGALAGFLVWNRPPASIFLGNGGAYAVGLLLAASAAGLIVDAGWRGLFAAGACLGLFAFETCFTIARRVVTHTPLADGDRLHSYDLLAARVGSRTRSTVILWALGAAAAGVGLAVAWASPVIGLLLLGLVIGAGLVAGVRLWTWHQEVTRRHD